MKAKASKQPGDELRPEYEFDFSKAERGRYAGRLKPIFYTSLKIPSLIQAHTAH